VYSHFKKIASNIGMPGLRFHDLRHSYAVNALQSGDDVNTVQETLGHHTAAFTLDIYGFVTD
jgi:integrase